MLVPSAGNVLKYERVVMFYHREPETRANFIALTTKGGRQLSLTALHLLPFGSCAEMRRYSKYSQNTVYSSLSSSESVEKAMEAARFASKARVGDCLLVVEDDRLLVDPIVKVRVDQKCG